MDSYADDVIDGARANLKNLLELKFYPNDPKAVDFHAIHRALLKLPGGVLATSFKGATGNPKYACLHLRESHAFVYHMPSKQYRYANKEYQQAAKLL